jgi:hypothetical protein
MLQLQKRRKHQQINQKTAAANQAAGNAIKGYVTKMGLEAENLDIGFDGKQAL